MREKYRSYTFRTGEPESHVDAAQTVCDFVDGLKNEFFTHQREDFEFPDGFKHQFDIVIRKRTGTLGSVISHFVEMGDVGDDSKHQLPHKAQLINDGLVKDHVVVYYENAKYVKINKDDATYRNFVLKKKLRLL